MARQRKYLLARIAAIYPLTEAWERVQNRKAAYTEWKEPTLKIDTTNDLKVSTTKAIRYIQEII